MKNSADLFKVTKWLILAAGTWKLGLVGVPKIWQYIYKIYAAAIQLVYYSFLVSVILSFYHFWGVDTDKANECLSVLTMMILLIVKMVFCQTKRMSELLAKAIDDVHSSFLNGDKYIKSVILSHSRYINILNAFITIFSLDVGLNLNIVSFLEYRDFKQNNPNITDDLEIPHLNMYWFPFNTNKYYGVVVFYQLATIMLTVLYNSVNETLLNSIITQLSVQLKILQYNFRNFTIETSTGEKVSEHLALKKLKELVRKHQELINYSKDLNEALKYPILLEYVVSSLMIATILLQIINGEKVVFNVQYLLILTFQWFILSWNSNEIRLQSEHLAYSLYESLWYEQNRATNKILFIMVLRCRIPLSLKIGPFGPLTNDAAVSRLKLAYSYLSLIS